MIRVTLLLVLVAACGGGEGDDTTGDDTSTGDDATGDDTTGDDTTGDDTTDPPDTRLYPLEVGRTWTYAVTSTYPSCPAGTRDLEVTGESTTEGRDTYDVIGFCGLAGHTSVAGDVVEEYYDWGPTGWMRALDEPVADGHTWTTTNGSATFGMTYADEGPTAGHDDCWRVTQEVSYTTYWIYCRGVGLVHYELVDLAGGTIRAELVETSF